jgi:hypothetical protein
VAALVGACAGQGEGDVCDPRNGNNDCQDGYTCTPPQPSQPSNSGYRCCPGDIAIATQAACKAGVGVGDASTGPATTGTPDAAVTDSGDSSDSTVEDVAAMADVTSDGLEEASGDDGAAPDGTVEASLGSPDGSNDGPGE